jgi:hypothetical protein
MAKIVGLSRSIKLEWLNKTVDLINQGKSEIEIKEELNEYLAFEIQSPTNIRKSRDILMNIWFKTPDENAKIKEFALRSYNTDKTNKQAIHWCMMLLTYPVFSDVCGLIGKLTNIQDTFTTAWTRQKLFEMWGERTTLLHSIDKILQTLKYVGAIENEKTGIYKVIKNEIIDEMTIKLIIMTIIALREKAYYEVSELSQVPQMFPFKYIVNHEMLHNSELFTLNNFGGKVVLTDE